MKCLCCLCMEGGVDKHAWEKQGTRLTLICMGCLPLFHVFLHHGAAGSAAPHPTKDMDIEQDKTLTFHHHLSSPLLFSHPRSSFFWHCAGVPQSCSTLTVCEGKCDKLEARPCSEKEQSEVEGGISAIRKCAAFLMAGNASGMSALTQGTFLPDSF